MALGWRLLAAVLLAAIMVFVLGPLRHGTPGAPPPAAGAPPLPLRGLAIVLDPGHGGIDSGAVAAGVREKDINLAVALAVARRLSDLGARVVMTRRTDVAPVPRGQQRYLRDRRRRAEMARESGAQVFVSIHANHVGSPGPRGPLVLWNPAGSPGGRALAAAIRGSLQSALRVPVRLARQGVQVLQWSGVPAALIETGFLSNPEERAALQRPAYQASLGGAIAAGVRAYWISQRAQQTLLRGLTWSGA